MRRVVILIFGIILYGLGIVLSINANIGVAPWDAFHLGMSYKTGVSIGQASMIVGFIIVLLNYKLGEKIGIGTLLNIFGIGLVIDVLFFIDIIPVMNNLAGGLAMIFLSMVTVSFATLFYIGAGFGAGPRDGLMVGLVKLTNKKVGLIRGVIELSALTIGYLMGGKIGIGTIILGVSIGPIMQYVFKLFKFDVKSIEHQYIIGNNNSVI